MRTYPIAATSLTRMRLSPRGSQIRSLRHPCAITALRITAIATTMCAQRKRIKYVSRWRAPKARATTATTMEQLCDVTARYGNAQWCLASAARRKVKCKSRTHACGVIYFGYFWKRDDEVAAHVIVRSGRYDVSAGNVFAPARRTLYAHPRTSCIAQCI